MLEIAQEIGGIPNVENYMKSNERKNDILQQDRYAKETDGDFQARLDAHEAQYQPGGEKYRPDAHG